jgi:negative regulator of flagellin synthesis FlgM
MSLYDVSKLSAVGPLRGVGRELSGEKPAARTERANGAADQGVSVQTGAKVSAGAAPVDAERVAEIRQALRDGSYPLVPSKITDAIIAARHMLSDAR